VGTVGPRLLIVDTDVLIDAARDVPVALDVLNAAQSDQQSSISSVTEMELLIGCRNKAEMRALNRFLDRFSRIPLDEAITSEAIRLLQEFYLSHGLLIADALIAATCLVYDAALISKNQRDYHSFQTWTFFRTRHHRREPVRLDATLRPTRGAPAMRKRFRYTRAAAQLP
jgi:predicted nucleic acid-binding protein